MNSEILKRFKEEYNQKLQEKADNENNLRILNKRKKVMENSPMIKDYIELLDQINDLCAELRNTDNLFYSTLYKYNRLGLLEDTNQIYFFAGSFYYDYGFNIQVDRNSSDAEFNRYIDIESLNGVDIPIPDSSDFEKNNSVIVLNNYPNNNQLYRIHYDFVKDSLENGEEYACQRVLKK